MAHRILFSVVASFFTLFFVELPSALTKDMYKSQLPPNCPPNNAYERKIVLYRLFHATDLTESYKNHVELYPTNEGYKTMCEAHALSFFDNIETLKGLLKKENNIGKKIAKVEINEKDGKLGERKNNGHYNFWPYESLDINSVKFDFIEV